MKKINLIFILMFSLLGCSPKVIENSSETALMEKLKNTSYGDAYSVIAHAGGGVLKLNNEYETYSNSLEALKASALDGKKLIELDLNKTSDGVIVAVHDWKEFKFKNQIVSDQLIFNFDKTPLSYEDFRNVSNKSPFTYMDIKDINDFFSKNPNLILVTDKIKDLSLLVDKFKFKNRLLVETFDIEGYNLALELGIKNVAFNISIHDEDIVDWVLENKIKIVTFRAREVAKSEIAFRIAKKLYDNGVVNLGYSTNDSVFMKQTLGVSVSAFYTDYWSIQEKRCIAPGGCFTY